MHEEQKRFIDENVLKNFPAAPLVGKRARTCIRLCGAHGVRHHWEWNVRKTWCIHHGQEREDASEWWWEDQIASQVAGDDLFRDDALNLQYVFNSRFWAGMCIRLRPKCIHLLCRGIGRFWILFGLVSCRLYPLGSWKSLEFPRNICYEASGK